MTRVSLTKEGIEICLVRLGLVHANALPEAAFTQVTSTYFNDV